MLQLLLYSAGLSSHHCCTGATSSHHDASVTRISNHSLLSCSGPLDKGETDITSNHLHLKIPDIVDRSSKLDFIQQRPYRERRNTRLRTALDRIFPSKKRFSGQTIAAKPSGDKMLQAWSVVLLTKDVQTTLVSHATKHL